MRETVKIKSDNKEAHPHGYYTQWRDQMKDGDVEYKEPKKAPKKEDTKGK